MAAAKISTDLEKEYWHQLMYSLQTWNIPDLCLDFDGLFWTSLTRITLLFLIGMLWKQKQTFR